MREVLEIPGYYYDSEKGRYFKIEAHGNPSNPYSTGNVAKRRQADEERARNAQDVRLRAERLENLRSIQRWPDSSCSVRGYMNSREIGPSQTSKNRDYLLARMMSLRRMWHITRGHYTEVERVTAFALDESSGNVVLGTHGGLVSAMCTRTEFTNIMPQTALTRFNAPVSSISISEPADEKTIVCCSMGNESQSGALILARFTDFQNSGPLLYLEMKPSIKQALFCTTVSRYTPQMCAIGGEDVILFTKSLNESQSLKTETCCMALEFIGPHTLLSGGRTGVIKLYDFRAEPGGPVTNFKIYHPSTVAHMRQVQDHFLVVAGLEHSLVMYDLRFVKTDARSKSSQLTSPVMRYSGHRNTVTLRLGFAVSSNESILAAAGDDQYVRLWSVSTGRRIHARVSKKAFDDQIVGLRFSCQKEDEGLWIAQKHLEYWSV